MKILIIDIETTGFLRKGSIIEVGMVSLNLNTGGVKVLFDSLCCENIFSDKHYEHPLGWIFNNSDITPDNIWDAPDFDTLKEEMQYHIDNHKLGATAFNNIFDFKFLEDRGLTFGIKLPCPMKLATPIIKLPQKGNRGGYKWPNVEEAWKHFFPDTQYTELHRGADDARHEAYIIYELYKLGKFKVEGI